MANKIRVAINGLGRIGRVAFRIAAERDDMEIVGVNDPKDPEYIAYLLNYDTVHGRYKKRVEVKDGQLILDGKIIRKSGKRGENQPFQWGNWNVDCVIEASGRYKNAESAAIHLDAGAKKVIITAPVADDTPMFVYGVNHTNYRGEPIISNASCTTNCLAPLAKVIHDQYGIIEGLMTTVHAITNSQNTVDASNDKKWRLGRAASGNIIPSTTGAASAVGKVIPELNGKITGMAFRVPTLDVSVVDLTCRLEHSTTYDEIKKTMKHAAENELKNVLAYVEDPIVSSDIIGESCTSVFDANAGGALNNNFMKLIAWYDNEWGYASKVLDMVAYTAKYDLIKETQQEKIYEKALS